MKALVTSDSLPRIIATRLAATLSPRAYVGPFAPLALREVPEPKLLGEDWVVVRTALCGICGSDYKQIFLKGHMNNPMTAMISFPQVLGHEVVGTIVKAGSRAGSRKIGERVALNPWLSCTPRGIDPLCDWCTRGEYAQCLNFVRGALPPGIHHGNSTGAPGGFADLLPVHQSQCIPIPEGLSLEQAVLADPFSVSLHAILHHPPPPNGTVVVYGCGTLGLTALAVLRALFPEVRTIAVARFEHQRRLATHFGADRVLSWRPTGEIITAVGEECRTQELKPWSGQPMLNDGVDAVYDTIGSAESLEVAVRIVKSRGHVVVTGVEAPQRFEWTPLYFKEIFLVGSNGFGIEEIGGRRQHAFEWYFELIRTHQVDVTPIITHRFALSEYRQAFLSCYDQGKSTAIKVLFEF